MKSVKDLAKIFENAAPKTAPPKPVKGASVKCSKPVPPPDKPKLIAVELPDSSVLAAKGMQYVNLPGADKWIDAAKGPKNKNRQTQIPPVLVRFNKPCSESFKIKEVPGGSNSAYSVAEEGRDANFTHEKTEKTYSTDADGTKTITDLQISCAGKDVYKYTAVDDYGNTATSVEIETIRRVYIQELKMQGLATVAATLATFTGEFAKHGIELIQLPSHAMTHLQNVGTDTGPFATEARKGYVASACSAKEPYVVALAYTDQLAVKEQTTLSYTGINVGPGQAPRRLSVVVGGNAKSLWKNIVTGEDWYVSGTFVRDGETAVVNIPAGLVTAVADDPGVADDCTTVSVDVAALEKLVNANWLRKLFDRVSPFVGTITLTLNIVNRMRGGISIGGGNLICVCTRAWWRPISGDEQNQTMVHEMGHKVGMVPTGTTLDATPNQYTGKGHVGSHCHTGLAVLASYSNVTGTCVMFGATNNKSAFCADCAKAVKKVDLSAGWSAF
jgi:type VI secretion system secreted protein VgrG